MSQCLYLKQLHWNKKVKSAKKFPCFDDDDDAQAFIELLLDISLASNIVQNNAK